MSSFDYLFEKTAAKKKKNTPLEDKLYPITKSEDEYLVINQLGEYVPITDLVDDKMQNYFKKMNVYSPLLVGGMVGTPVGSVAGGIIGQNLLKRMGRLDNISSKEWAPLAAAAAGTALGAAPGITIGALSARQIDKAWKEIPVETRKEIAKRYYNVVEE